MHLRQINKFLILCGLILFTKPGFSDSSEINKTISAYTYFRYSINSINEDKAKDSIESIRLVDNKSRIGIIGSLSKGKIRTFFHFQAHAMVQSDPNGYAFRQRYFYGGIETQYGKLTLGKLTNAYKKPGLTINYLYNCSHINSDGSFVPTGSIYGLSLANNGFTNNTIQYETPQIAGFKAIGSIHLDNTNKMDYGYIAGGSFERGNLIIGGRYARQSNESITICGIDPYGVAMRIYGIWENEKYQWGVSVENIDADYVNANYYYGSTTIKLNDIQTNLYLAVGAIDSGPYQGYGFSIAAFHNILEEIQVYTLISYVTIQNNTTPKVFALGANYNLDFSIAN